MFDFKIDTKTAIEFYLTATGKNNVSADFLIEIWKQTHSNSRNGEYLIEITKLKRLEFSEKFKIKEAMVFNHIKRLVGGGFLIPKTGFKGVYIYNPNEEVDYIMGHRFDGEFKFSITSVDDLKSETYSNSNYSKSGNLKYSTELERYCLIDNTGKSIHEFHCGDACQMRYNNTWYDTRIEMNAKGQWYFIKPDKSIKKWPRKLDNLEVRL